MGGSSPACEQSTKLKEQSTHDLVDPTGLKPAPHGLKGRRSVTRAPGQQAEFRVWSSEFRVKIQLQTRNPKLETAKLAVAEGFEPSHGRINSAVPYQLGYATRKARMKAEG